MLLTDEGLDLIEHQADKMKNVKLMLQIQTLREIRELKRLLKAHKDSGNSSNSYNDADCKEGEDGNMEKLDKTIEVLCDRVKVASDNARICDVAELTKALADLVTARANMELSIRLAQSGGSADDRKRRDDAEDDSWMPEKVVTELTDKVNLATGTILRTL